MSISYENLTEACSWVREYTEKVTRASVIEECILWCEDRGHTFIQADFDYEVFYYKEH